MLISVDLALPMDCEFWLQYQSKRTSTDDGAIGVISHCRLNHVVYVYVRLFRMTTVKTLQVNINSSRSISLNLGLLINVFIYHSWGKITWDLVGEGEIMRPFPTVVLCLSLLGGGGRDHEERGARCSGWPWAGRHLPPVRDFSCQRCRVKVAYSLNPQGKFCPFHSQDPTLPYIRAWCGLWWWHGWSLEMPPWIPRTSWVFLWRTLKRSRFSERC